MSVLTRPLLSVCITIRAGCMLLCMFIGGKAAAQNKGGKKEQEKVPVYNYVIDDPMDAFGRQPQQQNTMRMVPMPEFCMNAGKKADTMYWYEYYNGANQVMIPDTLTDHTRLRYVSLLEGYTDKEHTYKDAKGELQPLPVSKIIYRYDRMGGDKWLSVNYKSNKTIRLQEYVNEIVRTDTVKSTDGNTIIRKYYRVSQIP